MAKDIGIDLGTSRERGGRSGYPGCCTYVPQPHFFV